MTDILTYTLTVFMGFFAIMNPIANTPIFISLVSGEDGPTKRKIARTSTITAFIIVVAFVFLGKYIFQLFDITIPSFKITGGILIFYIGFEMLMSKKSKVQDTNEHEHDTGVAISPLAIPILAGPGTIVTAMNFVTHASYTHVGIVVATFAFLLFMTYLAFVFGNIIIEKVGQGLIMVIGKIMGLILAIIGTGMVIEGIKLAFNIS